MVTEEEIIRFLGEAGKDGLAFKSIVDKLHIKPRASSDKDRRDEVQRVLEKLIESGKVTKRKKRYVLLERNQGTMEPSPTSPSTPQAPQFPMDPEDFKRLIKEAVAESLREFFSSDGKVTFKDFDEVYDAVRDGFGYAGIDAIRRELGLTEQQFYSLFRRHILEKYTLIQGGKEGLIRGGIMYGIIKRKNG